MGMEQYGIQNGLISGPGQSLQGNQVRTPDLFDSYRHAAERFQNACKAVYQANVERAEAEKALQDVSQQVTAVIQQSLMDPTVPSQPVMVAPTNGRW